MKTILYGHAWLSGALTGFAFFGFLRAFNTTQQVWLWVSVVSVGLLWTLLGFSYVARRDGEGWSGENLEGAAPPPGAERPAEEVANPSRRRGTPMKYGAPLLMLLAFLAVVVLLAGAVGGWWTITTRPPPRPFVNPTGAPRPPRLPGRG